MSEAFRLGGWGMYPTTVIGLVLVYCALRYAVTPEAARALVVRRLSVLTFTVGCLGFVTGLIKSFVAVPDGSPGSYVIVGIGESLNNIGLALVLLVISGLAMSIGAARRAATAGPELTDPHG